MPLGKYSQQSQFVFSSLGPSQGRVGIGEVDRHRRGQGDLRVLDHLAALVSRQQCLHHLGQVVN